MESEFGAEKSAAMSAGAVGWARHRHDRHSTALIVRVYRAGPRRHAPASSAGNSRFAFVILLVDFRL